MTKKITFIYQQKEHQATLIFRRGIKKVTYRIDEGKMRISSPYFVSINEIKNHLKKLPEEFLNKLVIVSPQEKGYIYLLGEKKTIIQINDYQNEENVLTYVDEKDLQRKIISLGHQVFVERTRFYEKVMGINLQYKVRVRKMTTRYGSNSLSTRSLTFNIKLLEYPLSVIDAIVVHELAHHRYRDHSSAFYNEVLKYYPNYKKEYKRLKEKYQ